MTLAFLQNFMDNIFVQFMRENTITGEGAHKSYKSSNTWPAQYPREDDINHISLVVV